MSQRQDWGFPLIRDLPPVVSTKGWRWKEFPGHRFFWIGIDENSNSWLVKQKGTWNAIREHIYADFAQTLGICTQSSIYLILDKGSMPLQSEWHPDQTSHNVGLWKFEERGGEPCSEKCPFHGLRNLKSLQSWMESGITNPRDMIEARFLGYLCAMFEPTQTLIDPSHLWVQIDNELTFSDLRSRGRSTYARVMGEIQHDPYFRMDGAQPVLQDLCSRVSDFSDTEIDRIVATPVEFRCRTLATQVERYLKRIRIAARAISDRLFSQKL
jgi:hypothetical protein